MKRNWITSVAAVLSLAAITSVGYLAQAEEAPAAADSNAQSVSAPGDEALTQDPSVTADTDDPAPDACRLDSCGYVHDYCVCSNTGWNGYCDWGPIHPGCIYCHCD